MAGTGAGQPSIVWTDSTGPAILTTPIPYLGNWKPDILDVGSSSTLLGSGLVNRFLFRQDYVASFELPYLPMNLEPLLMRLKDWLASGGQITVNTNDNARRSYTCVIWPGDSKQGDPKYPTWSLVREDLEYTLQVFIKNVANAPLIAIYPNDGGAGSDTGFPLVVVSPSSLALTFPT